MHSLLSFAIFFAGDGIIIKPTSRPQHSFNNYLMPGRHRRERIKKDTRAGREL